MDELEIVVGGQQRLGLDLQYDGAAGALVVVSVEAHKAETNATRAAIQSARAGDAVISVDGSSVEGNSLEECTERLRVALDSPGMKLLRLKTRAAVPDAIESSLRTSSFFEPLYILVSDVSSWYSARKQLGGRRHMTRDIVRLRGVAADRFPGGVGYEAFYYAMMPDEETEDVVPKRLSAGCAQTAHEAWTLADRRCRARDETKEETGDSFHYKVEVVSPTFVGLGQRDRADLVVAALLEDARFYEYSSVLPRGFATTLPSNSAMTHKLQFQKRLAAQIERRHLILHLKTPAQWRPKEFAAEPVEERDDRRLFRRDSFFVDEFRKKLNDARSSKLVFNDIVAGTKPFKEEPVRGHFFHSLPLAHRKFLLKKQKHADDRDADKNVRDGRTSCSVFANAIVRDPAKEQIMAAKQAAARHAASFKIHAESALRLQRIYRGSIFLKAFRRRNRRHLAATRIQRHVRGLFGSIYSRLYRKLLVLAATRISSMYRMVVATRRTRTRRGVLTQAALHIQRVFRGWQSRAYVGWVRLNWHRSTAICKVVRGFLARCRYISHVIRRFNRILDIKRRRRSRLPHSARVAILPIAATRVQTSTRRCLARIAFVERREKWIDETVVRPARLKLQRVWRGGLSRFESRKRRRKLAAAIAIQTAHRARRARNWRNRRLGHRRRRAAATNLQRIGRGYLDRCVAKLTRRARLTYRVREVGVPGAQALVRRKQARVRVARLKKIGFVAIRVQRAWRTYLSVREAAFLRDRLMKIKRIAGAVILQRRCRGLLARRLRAELWHSMNGRRIRSARVILRAWRTSRNWIRWDALRDDWRVEQAENEIERLGEMRKEIERDLDEIQASRDDVGRKRRWTLGRLEELETLSIEAERRLPEVRAEIELLDENDEKAGWTEALGNEWDRLVAHLRLSKEEKRLLKEATRRYDEQLVRLQFEYEESEVEVDEVELALVAQYERLRRLELGTAEKFARRDKNRRASIERMRWRVRDVRTSLLVGARRDPPANLETRATLKETYDAVVSSCATLIQDATLGMRNN